MEEAFTFGGDPRSRVLATAIHAGHDLRPELHAHVALDEATRLQEEDPYTDRIAACIDSHLLVSRSRFEVDLNRARAQAVYRTPDEAWGLHVWRSPLPDEVAERSLETYDAFYDALGRHLDRLAADGPFLVYDIHSYNHRRGEDRARAPQHENPDLNVGTGSLPPRWAPVVEAFIDELDGRQVGHQRLDVRENIRFEGANLAEWVHARHPDTGCVLALEFKKTFMDEWTGEVEADELDALGEALRHATPRVLEALQGAAS